MIYPKIYSLSTVGIIKHYNHDYLFHHKRTDFIGPNGVGKSILADLIQMMFVFDKELIKFGTVDVKESRYIHTLPYKTKCGYSFLNIIIDDKKYITLGIQINNQSGKRIIPFIITKDTDLTKDKQLLALNNTEILFAKDFVSNGTIPDFQELAKYLNDTKELKLQYFRTKDEVQKYYRFLSDQKILPINLSLDKNLKAYAKVIQSFSKAQSLKLGGDNASKNLKEFLFEEANDDILKTFETEKTSLDKVLSDYNRLNQDIKLLIQKQSKLKELTKQSKECDHALKNYKLDEISNCYLELNEQKNLEIAGRQLLTKQKGEIEKVRILLEKIPELKTKVRQNYEEAEINYNQVSKYRQLLDKIEKVNGEITELRMVILPNIDDSWKKTDVKADISQRTASDIKNEVTFVKPFLEKYQTLSNLEEVRIRQNEEISQLTKQLEASQDKIKKTLHLLQSGNENSLLDWYIRNSTQLRPEQIQAILHFSTLPINPISDPELGDKFIVPDEVSDIKITKTENGLWLKAGALSEFIHQNSDAELLANPQDFKTNIDQLVTKLKKELELVERKLVALNAVRDGLEYEKDLFETIFDPKISERSSIENLKKSISCILQRDAKINELSSEKFKAEQELSALQQQFKLQFTEPEVIERDLKIIKDRWFNRITKLSSYEGSKEKERDQTQKEIKTTVSELEKTTRNIISSQNVFNELNTAYYRTFQENISAFHSEKKDVENSKNIYDDLYSTYKRNYIEAVSDFEETQKRKNAEVNYELDQHTYSFAVLERALLGNRIKTIDDISTALQDANNNRTQIADSIRDNMLKIFNRISDDYKKYKVHIQDINTFFINRKISAKYYFNVKFSPNTEIDIKYIEDLAFEVRKAANSGELQFDQSITDFLEGFFKKLAKLKETVPIRKLLDPKTYFELSAKLEDEFGNEMSGSTGESYSAIALLGVARLSSKKVEQEGLRFIILEELGSIDNTNFNIFPDIAEEFNYQILTMAPHAFNIGLADDWYAHHLIKGKDDANINYYPSASYFKTKDHNEQLDVYLNKMVE